MNTRMSIALARASVAALLVAAAAGRRCFDVFNWDSDRLSPGRLPRMRLIAWLSAVATLAALPFVAAGSECGDPPSMDPLTFEVPQIADTVRAGGEPSVLGLGDGTLVYAAHASTTLFYRNNMPDPDYFTPYTGATYVWRSGDDGETWEYIGLEATGVGPHATVSGFSDPDLTTDAEGNVYTSGINLANVYVAKSSDSGETWRGHPFGTLMTDREWIAADEENVVYMNGNETASGRRLWKSKDGGLTFNLLQPRALAGGGPPSKIQVDQTDGRLYFPVGDGRVQVFPDARDDDFGYFLAEVPSGTPHAHGFLNSLALDSAGNVYLVSNTATQIRVSWSIDRGASWQTMTVHSGNKTVLWPWISAGDDGRVGISWFQADRFVSDTESQYAEYRVMAAQTVTGHGWTDFCGTSHDPVWDITVATDAPFHSGTICSSGTFCQVSGIDRRLGDYHTNSITADGKFVIAYADTSFKPTSAISRPGFLRQSGGADFRP